jgi:hypothetical protein
MSSGIKKYSFLEMIIIIPSCLLFTMRDFSRERDNGQSLDNPVKDSGAVSFILNTDKTYRNGSPEENFSQILLKLPGLATCLLQRDTSGIFITMQWDSGGTHTGYYILLTELPGPAKYHIQFTWDAEKGLSDGYFNGIPIRLENPLYCQRWEVKGTATRVYVPGGPNRVADVHVSNRYRPRDEAMTRVPKALKGKYDYLLGQKDLPPPMDIGGKKGKLLYSTRMDSEASMKDWVLEGPGIIDFVDNSTIMRSQIPNPPDGSTGHFNYWCPESFPDNIVVEWEFKPFTDKGVCHLFFAAKGQKGEDIFDSALPKRDGHFQQYINGVINNYYFIYFSNLDLMRTSNMATVWLAKSSKQSIMALGQIGITPGVKEFHRMRMIKEDAHMQLQVNGKVYLDFTDPGSERWGPVLGGGRISFRQMAVTMAAYRNFNVWELK